MNLRQFFIALIIFVSLLYGTTLHYLPIGERDIQLDLGTLWQQSNVWGDAEMYLNQVEDFNLSMAPYRYRVLPTLAVRAIDSMMGVHPIIGYVIFNSLCFLAVGVGFVAYLMRWHGFSYPMSLVGGILAVTTVSMQSMVLLPMAEPASYVAALIVFWSLQTRSRILFAGAASAAVLTKEVFIVAIPIWLVLELYSAAGPGSMLRGRAHDLWRSRA